MAIIVNPSPPPDYIVSGRIGASQSVKKWVDGRARQAMLPTTAGYDPLGTMERLFDPGKTHASQGTMRAHHIADSSIQEMVCDFMNGQITRTQLLDMVGTLYLTGWIDVIVTPYIFMVWTQWAEANLDAFDLMISKMLKARKVDLADTATRLCDTLSSSLSNLRIGHGVTDAALGNAIAPRLQRGQADLLGLFVAWLTGHDFSKPTYSFETSVVARTWGAQFIRHPPRLGAGLTIKNKVFVGPVGGNRILISEEMPHPGAPRATTATANFYPGTQGQSAYAFRLGRATMHAGSAALIVAGFVGIGSYLFSSMNTRRKESK